MKEAPEPFSLTTAWDSLRAWLKTMVAAFGEPAAIAASLLLRRDDRRHILQWLEPLEAGVRRMLLMEAVKLVKPNEPPTPVLRTPPSVSFREEPVREIPEDSRQWRVSFRVWPKGARLAQPRTQAAVRASKRVIHYNAYSLARRIEAVIRVFENPNAYITKIARRIHVAPNITRALFRPHRFVQRGAEFMLREIYRETECALEKLDYG